MTRYDAAVGVSLLAALTLVNLKPVVDDSHRETTQSRSVAQGIAPRADLAPGTHDTLVVLFKDRASGIRHALRAVAKDSSAFQMLWAEVVAPYGQRPPKKPQINFQDEMVIVAAMGFSAGEIIVDSTARSRHGLTVFERLVVPGPGCVIPAEVTTPVSIVKVATDSRLPLFRDSLVTISCNSTR